MPRQLDCFISVYVDVEGILELAVRPIILNSLATGNPACKMSICNEVLQHFATL